MDKKPLKRNKNIFILSREHHTSLLFCWKIRQGLRKNVSAERMQPYVTYFWTNHLQQHFRDEEEQMFLKVNDELCQKALLQHVEIKNLITRVTNSTPDPDLLNQLANTVDVHIRFEERVLFPHLEKILSEPELKSIGLALEQSHTTPVNDNFADTFWIK